MNLADYIVIGILAFIAAGVVVWLIRRKKRGKSTCGGCPYSGNCSGRQCTYEKK